MKAVNLVSYKISMDEKVTDSTMTPNEYTKLLSVRARQLQVGFKSVIKWDKKFDPIAIAKEELNQRVIPLVIVRKIPNANEY